MRNPNMYRNGFRYTLLILALSWITTATTYSQTLGDVDGNGSVDIVDALMIARHSTGMSPPGFITGNADANDDGSINIIDALVTAQYYTGLIDSLPPGPPPTEVPHIDNPFEAAKWYVNPLWSQKAIEGGGAAVAGYNTAIWLNRISTINEGMGVRGHLNEALAQGAGVILFVIANLPNRNCSSGIPRSELHIANGDMARYKAEFIDPMVAIFSDPAYNSINIVCIIEPDTMANHITCCSRPLCEEATGVGGFIEGIQYTLNRLNTVSNVYNYIPFTHSGWLGWDDNFRMGISHFSSAVKGTTKGVNSIDGFITNLAYYTPLAEPFLPNPDLQIGGQPVRSSDFYEWNSYFGEIEFARAIYTALLHQGFPASIGMLIDTSRNGWGGPDRPHSVSTSTDLNTYVNESRIDRRDHRGNWCNQAGGLGERPQPNPAENIDAYVWGWAPGYSDGISEAGIPDPNDPVNIFDEMCDPEGDSRYNSDYGTGAVIAPHQGHWNREYFELLLQNAYPPL